MEAHSSILGWKIPWIGDLDRLCTDHGGCKESDMTEHAHAMGYKAFCPAPEGTAASHPKSPWWQGLAVVLSLVIGQIVLRGWVLGLLSHSVMSDCEPMDCHPPGSSARGFFQARILE